MLENADMFAVVAVKNMDSAKKFYEDTLGFKPARTIGESVVIYKAGNGNLQVYVSESAGTNQATSVTWLVDDLKQTTKMLDGAGIKFEHYDFPNVKYDGDIHIMGDQQAAWFKDPDGNTLAIVPRN
jgi:extradiol dioxygenase family protein